MSHTVNSLASGNASITTSKPHPLALLPASTPDMPSLTGLCLFFLPANRSYGTSLLGSIFVLPVCRSRRSLGGLSIRKSTGGSSSASFRKTGYHIFVCKAPDMQIRRNTKAFKAILEIVSTCQSRPDREQLIRLFITKAGSTIRDRISVDSIEGGADLFYDMGYQAVLNNLRSSNYQLHQSDDQPGIYFFHSTSNKTWDETPFEFDDAVKKEFASLPELPVTRKKEKMQKFAFPLPAVRKESTSRKQAKPSPKTTRKIVEKGPKQPNFKLKHEIDFTRPDSIVFRQGNITKKDVLEYYDKIAKYILPHLKDRPVVVLRRPDNAQSKELRVAADLGKKEATPGWIQTTPADNGKDELLLCPDKEHLLFYVERGGLAFAAMNSRRKTIDVPDYILIGLDSDAEFTKTIDVALATREILDGLKLPSFVKSDGDSGLHLYIPLDTDGDFATTQKVAAYLCKLIRVKSPDLVYMEGADDNAFRKVSLNYQINAKEERVIAPYSIAHDQPNIAVPIRWEDVSANLKAERFSLAAIADKPEVAGDPFLFPFRRKVNADMLLKRLDEDYSFLF